MRTFTIAAAAVFLACILSADAARGQRTSTPVRPGFQLLRSEAVQQELKLTPQQVKSFQELWDERIVEMRELFLNTRRDRSQPISREERDKRTEAARSLVTEHNKKLDMLLQPEQAARLSQIELQDRARFNVIGALRSRTVSAALALTDEQEKQLGGLQPPREPIRRPDGGDNRPAAGSRGRPVELKPELKDKALALLTDEQRQKLDELMGSPFDLLQVRRGIGGLGLVGGNREDVAERIFGRIDTNADGMASKEEAAASQTPMRGNFDRFDADSDEKVSLAEFKERFPISTRQTPAEVFAREDHDQNGKITKEEASFPPLQANFPEFDANSDGAVDKEEFEKAMAERSRGGFSAGRGNFLEAMFTRNDKDSDGKITESEAPQRFWSAFGRFDTNNDGAVDKEELTKALSERRTATGRCAGIPFGALFGENDKDSDGRILQNEANERFWDTYGDVDTDKDGAIDREEWAKASYQVAERAAGQRIIGIGMNEEAGGPGLLVYRVLDGSPAAAARLQEGDRCLEIDGKRVAAVSEFREAVRSGGKELALVILRNGEKIDVAVTFDE